MDIDFRIAIVLLPVILAAAWAGYNIFQAALGQLQSFLSKN
ncbi:MAG: photosystem II protein Y [Cyanobacteria bacterium]|nr:photosystem II protein Y [Cyanobacteriota bacterium]MDW8202391.1 photosystem II protein Y [Cyanobacteriota bacterium SKYGB_h_bin112]